jgi:hypothetical protein
MWSSVRAELRNHSGDYGIDEALTAVLGLGSPAQFFGSPVMIEQALVTFRWLPASHSPLKHGVPYSQNARAM